MTKKQFVLLCDSIILVRWTTRKCETNKSINKVCSINKMNVAIFFTA